MPIIRNQNDYLNCPTYKNLIILGNIKVSPDDDTALRNLHTWDVADCKNMDYMLAGCDIKSNIEGWDVSNCKSAKYMFKNCRTFNQDLSNWDVSKLRNMKGMFKKCVSLTHEFCWSISGKNARYAFQDCSRLSVNPANWGLAYIEHDNENAKNMYCAFKWCKNVEEILKTVRKNNHSIHRYSFKLFDSDSEEEVSDGTHEILIGLHSDWDERDYY